ncbi:TPA: hypothetical protein NJ353_003202 [Vibrio parahaemolyticus]|nr:hypothetical protein [Vibrio parahaemolyticus]
MDFTAEKSNTFFSSSLRPMLAAGTIALATTVSGYVHAGSCAEQSTSALYSPAPNKSAFRNDYRTLEEVSPTTEQIKAVKGFFASTETSFERSRQAQEQKSKAIVEDFIKSMTQKKVADTFSTRVDKVANAANFNKSQLASILRVERKSLYDWKKNPDVNVREATRHRVENLEQFISTMDVGHSQYIAKLAFGSNGHKDLADALLAENMDLSYLEQLYDKYWIEFDGFYTRAQIEKKTSGFDNLDGYGELV